jgi:hypothetical protein
MTHPRTMTRRWIVTLVPVLAVAVTAGLAAAPDLGPTVPAAATYDIDTPADTDATRARLVRFADVTGGPAGPVVTDPQGGDATVVIGGDSS